MYPEFDVAATASRVCAALESHFSAAGRLRRISILAVQVMLVTRLSSLLAGSNPTRFPLHDNKLRPRPSKAECPYLCCQSETRTNPRIPELSFSAISKLPNIDAVPDPEKTR